MRSGVPGYIKQVFRSAALIAGALFDAVSREALWCGGLPRQLYFVNSSMVGGSALG
jgi:hypothetical protein